MSFVLASESETTVFAALLAEWVRPADIICLFGDLGAGKTTFTRSLVHALGSPARVSSPTFTLIHEYSGGRLPIVHIDAYRLSGADDAAEAGFADYLDRDDCVIVIEWPERIAALVPAGHLDIVLSDIGDDHRSVLVQPHGERWMQELPNLAAFMSASVLRAPKQC